MKKRAKNLLQNCTEIKEFPDGYIMAKGPKNSNLPFALFDENGDQMTAFAYEKIEEAAGLFIVTRTLPKICKLDGDGTYEIHGVVNKDGVEIMPVKYRACQVNKQYIIVNEENGNLLTGSEVFSRDGDFIEYLPKNEKRKQMFISPK